MSWIIGIGWAQSAGAKQTVPPAVRYKTTLPAAAGHAFTRAQTLAFLETAHNAEAITDPLKRCLAYPDPPGSQWNHAAVAAYCRYRNQAIIPFAKVKRLVEAGHAAELDQLLAKVLHAQMTDPDAVGWLDHVYEKDFSNGSFAIRPILDAWKRQSPDSAFAYAASGMAYAQMAFKARGTGWMVKTPQYKVDSMTRLAIEANADLLHALKLNPHVTPIYSALMTLAGIAFNGKYAGSAIKLALTESPNDLSTVGHLMWLMEPKWFGSLHAMQAVADLASKHAAANPLLALEVEQPDIYRIDNCECTEAKQLPAYSAIIEHMVNVGTLESAGDAADDLDDVYPAAIYYSEVLRFDPGNVAAWVNRMYYLVDTHHALWAVADGSRVLAADPDNEGAAKARGWAYLTMGEARKAQHDLETATRLDPTDMWALWRLGEADAVEKQWSETWNIANRLVQQDPKHDEGWLLRLRVQAFQPRPGLAKTTAYIESHFSDDGQVRAQAAFAQALLKARAGHPGKTNAEVLKIMSAQRRG